MHRDNDDYIVLEDPVNAKHLQYEVNVKNWALPLVPKVIVLVTLSITLASMGSFIFLESSVFPCSQYLLTQAYIVCFFFLYFITYLSLLRGECVSYLKKFSLLQVSIIGIFWATNYTFILLSASHLTNSLQVIIAQSQSALIAIVDYQLVGIQLSWLKIACIAVSIGGNLLAIGSAGFTGGAGTVFWCFIFLINALASGLANLYSEVYMKTLLPPQSSLMERFKMIIALNMTSNFIGIFITFLGIPLARYSVGPDIPLYDFNIFTDIRILYWVGMLFSSYIYTTCAYLLLHSESSIFNAMCSGIGATIQLCFFMTPVAPYNEIPPTIVIISAVFVIASSLVYASKPELRDDTKMNESIFGHAVQSGTLDGMLGVMYLVTIVLYLAVDTIIPLLPTLTHCQDIYSVG